MLERAIPKTGEKLPAIGLGTWQTFDVGNSEAIRAPLREVLQQFAAAGGRVLDSSPMYGKSEGVAGELASRLTPPPRFFIATKVWTRGRSEGIAQMEDSFRLLRAPVIDLMQVHNLVDLDTHLPTLQAWQKSGRIRYLGVTHYHAGAHRDLEQQVRTRRFDFVQLNFSLAEREAEGRLLDACAEHGTAVIVNRPFAMGDLFRRVKGRPVPEWCGEFDCGSWAQFFLKWILAHPAVTCAIPATNNPKHMADNLLAGTGRMPDAAMRRRMAAHLDAL